MEKENTPTSASPLQVTPLSLPKGGGAIKGIGETFQPNSFSGTGSFSIPFNTSPARGFEPSIALSYNSGAGNGVFGMGFSTPIASISRRTEKGLPKYSNTDVFILGGTELVPIQKKINGQWMRVVEKGISLDGKTWDVYAYAPRIEGAFSLIQHWVEEKNNESYWKITGRDNSVSFFGKSATTRIANPNALDQIFEWLIQESTDAKGNKIRYSYLAEDNDNTVPSSLEFIHHQSCTNRYLQSIQYGNYFDTNQVEQFSFEVVFDYGERELTDSSLATTSANPYQKSKLWMARADAFSSFKSGFEIRTRRICQNILMFHRFAELGNTPCLVRRMKLEYNFSTLHTLQSVERIGYRRKTDGSYDIQKTPTLDLEFSIFKPNTTGDFKRLQTNDGDIPGSLDRAQFLPVDLNQEGIEGLLYSTEHGVFYFEPLGDGKYGAEKLERQFPAHSDLQNNHSTFADVSGNGHLDILVHRLETTSSGYYRKTGNESWSSFHAFSENAVETANVFIEQVGLSGNGKTDLLLVEEDSVVFYESLGDKGYAAPVRKQKPNDFPEIKRNFKEELVSFSNVFGDGLSHRIRISNGQIECWPSLGYGSFGEKIILANAPDFGHDFQINRLFMADVDGSGTMDLIYVYPERVALYINQNGNGFSDPIFVNLPEAYAEIDQIHFADVLGNGTSCLVFSKNDIHPRHYYYEFVGATIPRNSISEEILKPYLLIGTNNNMGATNQVKYVSSVKFYLADKKADTPWLQPLPFPVQVVEEVTSIDEVTGARMVHKFRYHDGFYDHAEKEFRGFGYIESWDSETLEEHQANYLTYSTAAVPNKLFVPPVYTRTWHHTGAYVSMKQIQARFYKGDVNAYQLPAPVFASTVLESGDEETLRQAQSAMFGHVLRSEIYGLDKTNLEQHPYTVSESNFTVKLWQERGNEPYAIFTLVPRESIAYQYERNPLDPRIQQEFVLATDEFDHVTLACNLALPRRTNSDTIQYAEQLAIKISASKTAYINQTTNLRQIGIPFETKSYEISGILTQANGYCLFEDISEKVKTALANEILYNAAFNGSTPQVRMLAWNRSYFWNESQTDVLGLGQINSRGLLHHSRSAVFSKDFISQSFNNRLTDTVIEQEGGYLLDTTTNHWWNRSAVAFWGTSNAFYQLIKIENTFAPTTSSLRQKTTVEYNAPYNLYAIQQDSWLTETIRNRTSGVVDYATVQIKQMIDANNNTHEVLFDALGQVIASSSYSFKANKRLGSMSLYASNANTPPAYQQRNLNQQGTAIIFDDVVNNPEFYLQGASSYFFYDLFAWSKKEKQNPISAISLVRDDFYYGDTGTSLFDCQMAVAYVDGFGRTILTKSQAEPATGFSRDAAGKLVRDANNKPTQSLLNTCWLASGKTIFNNKGNPAEQYLPYFVNTPYYENQQDIVSEKLVPPPTVIHYDPLQRN
ncbi:MAG: SpvB/TcaC N-terminal domain-containing protein, partial [Bacteroidia bacterium]